MEDKENRSSRNVLEAYGCTDNDEYYTLILHLR